MENIGNKIKKIREEKGLTQEKFAEILGISGKQVSKWELGKFKPSLKYLVKICELMSVSADWLILSRENKEKVPEDPFLKELGNLIMWAKRRKEQEELVGP